MIDGHHIVRCQCCGHLYVSPRPPIDEVIRIYDSNYFENPAFTTIDHDAYFGYRDYLRDRENIQRRLRQVLREIERHEWKGRLLDVGCGFGLFVEVARMSGWDAWGIDVNEHAVKWAREHVSDQVSHGIVEDLDVPDGWFDCVTMFDVIEHLDDPRTSLREVHRILRPGGLLVIVTPDAGSVVSRALGARWLEMKRAPEHLHFFSVASLAWLLPMCGLTGFEWHSFGKITTVRTVLADLRFYSDRLFGGIEALLDRWGLADRIVDIDPRTKLCMYARKTGELLPSDWVGPLGPVDIQRVRRRGFGRAGVRSVRDGGAQQRSDSSPNPFTVRQRRYWERKERFLDPREPGPSAFARPKLEWASRHLAIEESTSTLDVGAGSGTLTWHLAERAGRTIGLDFSRNLLNRSPCHGALVQGDALHLPFQNNAFDIVLEGNFLHHVDDPVAVLREMARVARVGVILVEPNRWHPPMSVFMLAKRSEWRGLRFDERFVRRLAESAGLTVTAAAPQGAIYPNQTPRAALGPLARFDHPGRLGAYVVAVLLVGNQVDGQSRPVPPA